MHMLCILRILAGIGYRICQGNFEMPGTLAWQLCLEMVRGRFLAPPAPNSTPNIGTHLVTAAGCRGCWKWCLDIFWHRQPQKCTQYWDLSCDRRGMPGRVGSTHTWTPSARASNFRPLLPISYIHVGGHILKYIAKSLARLWQFYHSLLCFSGRV